MKELNPQDLQWVVKMLPKAIVEMMIQRGRKVVLAGGFIRAAVARERPKDVDMFAPSQLEAKIYAEKLNNAGKYLTSKNAYTIPNKTRFCVQFIHRWCYPDPAELIESFDFTIARAAVWYDQLCEHKLVDGWSSINEVALPSGERARICGRCCLTSPQVDRPVAPGGGVWRSLVADTFYEDLAAKRLVYCSPQRNEDAGGSLLRVIRFVARGYVVPPSSLAAVVARLITGVEADRLDLNDPGLPLEARWAKNLLELLHEVDPEHTAAEIAELVRAGSAPKAVV